MEHPLSLGSNLLFLLFLLQVPSQGSKSSYKLKAEVLESSLVATRSTLALKESAHSKALEVNRVLRDSLAAREEEINHLR